MLEKTDPEHWNDFKGLLKRLAYIEISLAILSLFLIYPVIHYLKILYNIETYNFSMFSEFNIQATVFFALLIIFTVWNLAIQFSIYLQNIKIAFKIILVTLTLSIGFILSIVYIMPTVIKSMANISSGVPMFATIDVIQNTIIISTVIMAGVSLIFIIPFIHKNIVDLSFIKNHRSILYIFLVIASIVLTPTGDIFTMMATLVPAGICTEIGLLQIRRREKWYSE
jgi:hypothetical protein